MNILRITGPRATIEVENHKHLRSVWKDYRGNPLVGRFIVRKPLTESQLGRLPAELRERVSSPDDLAFLMRLYSLEDPRG